MAKDMKSKPENVLILQGGGSLGAFACGVYKALVKSKFCGDIDVVAGTSIGGVNAAIIAGCVNDQPEEALEQFWLELAENSSLRGFSVPQLFQAQAMESWSRNNFGSEFDAHVNAIGSFYLSATMGNSKMFVPRWLLSNASKDESFFAPHKWTYVYDHSPLAKTLERYVDYSKLNPKGKPHARLIITAVNVLTAEPLAFDSATQQISARHVLATSAYPLYFFPWVEVEEGVYCWDGGLLSNTPLREVIEASPVADKKIFIVENYPKNIQELPQNLAEVLHRARDIIFSDKTLHNVKMMKVITSYLRYIDELYGALEKADPSKVDPATRKKLERKYRKFKVERGAEILGIRYITREEKHPHVYENADFSIDTIRRSILEGELRAREVLEHMDEL